MNPLTPGDGDLTPVSDGPTDVTPVGRTAPKPAHEATAAEDIDVAEWDSIAADPEFQALLKSKAKFIIPATIFFVVYYFALPYLVGYHPALMEKRVWGEMNWAYLFALSQFIMAWCLAAVYVGVAAGWDRKAAAILKKFNR